MGTLPKYKLYGCPRCHGSLQLDEDSYVCIQCGYTEWLEPIKPLALVATNKTHEGKHIVYRKDT